MIEITNLTIEFNKTKIFNNLSLNLQTNKIYGMYGQNAIGKTSFFNALYNLIKFKGQIYFVNKIISPNNISYLETNNYYYKELTGNEFLKIFINFNPPEIFNFIELAELLNINLNEKLVNCSSGTLKKISFLGILKTNREIFFLDEPFNAMDTNSIEIFTNIIKKLKENNKTIFIISHDLNYLKSNCDNILYFSIKDKSTNIDLFIKDDFGLNLF